METLFQKILLEVKPELPFTLGVVDAKGRVVSCTEMCMVGNHIPAAVTFFNCGKEVGEFTGYTFRKLSPNHCGGAEHAVFAGETGGSAAIACGITAIAIEKAKLLPSDENNDRISFIKRLLFENILPEQVYAKAREMRIKDDVPRAAFLVRTEERRDGDLLELLKKVGPNGQKDFVIAMCDTEVVLIKELSQADGDEAVKIARQIDTAITEELRLQHTIGVSTIVGHLMDIAHAFREAQTAVSVSRVFSEELTIAYFESLWIGRLIYQLPTELCEMFLSEIFRDGSIHVLDAETLFTVHAFFENNLNVSETARKLFIHRNTLVYRLDKIKKLTGLDLREFDHAFVFQVALMVKKHLDAAKECG